MRFGFPQHLIAFLVVNTALFLLNMAPVGFDFDRPGVPIWFLYPLLGWSVLLIAHGVLLAAGVRFTRGDAPAPEPAPEPEAPRPVIDPSKAGRAGGLLAECRVRSGQTLSALGALGGVPVDIDDLLRGALDQAEHLAERLAPTYATLAKGDDAAASQLRDQLEAPLEALHTSLEILRLEAVVLQESGHTDLATLTGPLEQLREAILSAAEALAELG
jgi:hypothetical protein